MKLARALVLVASVVLPDQLAAADVTAGVHFGGGLEGGTMTGAPHPAGVVMAGFDVAWLLPDRNWGIGAAVEVVGRSSSLIERREEATYDLMLRGATVDRRVRFGAGFGLRTLLLEPVDAQTSEMILGVDMFRGDVAFQIASVRGLRIPATVAIDGYVAWTFGCYRGTRHGATSGDMLPPGHEVRCIDTITSTYVAGVQTTILW